MRGGARLGTTGRYGSGHRQFRGWRPDARTPARQLRRRAREPAGTGLHASEKNQRIDGFGATFTEGGLMTINKLPASRQEQLLQSLFDPSSGAGLTLMKSPLAAFDFASAGPWFSYDDVAGDTALDRFSIARDLEPNGQITFIQRARKHGSFRIQSTMDFPPDWMLDSRTKLKHEYFDACARYQVKYLQAYADRGVAIDMLAPFNEPQYIYCKTTYNEIGEYIKANLGPRLRESKLTTKLQFCESHNRATGLKEFPPALKDPGARGFVSSLSVHGYAWEESGSAPIGKLRAAFPDLPIWMSEVCYAWVIDKKPMPVHGFEDGDRWGRMILSDLENGVSGWIYWNMILDEKGGPWLVSENHGNPKKNDQHPLVIVDTQKGEVEYPGVYWYLAHFSRYLRPGAVRVRTSGEIRNVKAAGFVAANGSRVIEAVNSGADPVEIAVRDSGRTCVVKMPAKSIATVLWR